MTDHIEIRRGVRQGSILFSLLFNMYSEVIFNEALEEKGVGIIINRETINNIRYADDIVLLASNLSELQHLLEKVNDSCTKYRFKINLNNTKWMLIRKFLQNKISLTIANIMIERVQTYKFLGSWMEHMGD